jgi:hypothetical protein
MMRWLILTAVLVCFLVGCQSTSYTPPPVTPAMANVSSQQHVDLATLRDGRSLFVSRCIECHALPSISRHGAAEWPRLIDEMAGRANLKRSERDALLAYIVAVRSQ